MSVWTLHHLNGMSQLVSQSTLLLSMAGIVEYSKTGPSDTLLAVRGCYIPYAHFKRYQWVVHLSCRGLGVHVQLLFTSQDAVAVPARCNDSRCQPDNFSTTRQLSPTSLSSSFLSSLVESLYSVPLSVARSLCNQYLSAA